MIPVRERRERTIKSFSPHDSRLDAARRAVLRDLGLAAFTDEAIELFARELLSDLRYSEKLNRQNRLIYSRRQAAEAERQRMLGVVSGASVSAIPHLSEAMRAGEELVA